jgi:hypothetical protein
VNSLQQFRLLAGVCNSLQQIATHSGSEDRSRATKNPVVEHKELSDELMEFFSYLIGVKSL